MKPKICPATGYRLSKCLWDVYIADIGRKDIISTVRGHGLGKLKNDSVGTSQLRWFRGPSVPCTSWKIGFSIPSTYIKKKKCSMVVCTCNSSMGIAVGTGKHRDSSNQPV